MLRSVGIAAAPLHGEKTQATRRATVQSFRRGDVSVLVASDVASRGLDIPGVDFVVNVMAPVEARTYVHRAGRTARATASGAVLTLFNDHSRVSIRALFRDAGVTQRWWTITHDGLDDPEYRTVTGARQPSGRSLPTYSPTNTDAPPSRKDHAVSSETAAGHLRCSGNIQRSRGRYIDGRERFRASQKSSSERRYKSKRRKRGN